MDAIERSDLIEQATMTRIAEIYAGALQRALKKKKAFLQKIKDVDSGKIKPPQYYVDLDMVDKWREGFVRELMRQQAVIDGIMEELDAAGVDAAELIRKSMVDIYQANREETVQKLREASIGQGVNVSFAQYDKGQIAVLLQQQESPFTRLAYENMGQNPAIRRRLQNELAQATILGESQQKIIQRIRAVTGQGIAQARRVAQTERTRVQSQARHMAGQEAADKGIGIANEWSARMVNTRESHADLNGKKVMQGEKFRTIWGNELEFPGDPNAPAKEVINCFCVLEPDVLLPGQKLVDGKVVEVVKAAPAAEEKPAFVPAKSKAEATEYAKRFAQNVSFDGVSLENANKINEQLTILTAKYPINRLYEIKSGGKGVMSANYRTLNISRNKLGKVLEEDYNRFLENQEHTRSALELLSRRWAGKKMPFDVQKTVEKLKKVLLHKRWSISDSYPNKVAVTVTHEYGHILSDQYFGMINSDRANPHMQTNWSIRNVSSKWRALYEKAIENGDIYKVSEYGTTNDREFFAECFAARECGEKLPDYIEEFMEEVLTRGIM